MPNLGCYTLLTRDISFNLEAFIYYSNLPLHSPLSDILQIQKWRCLGLGSIENVTATRDVSRNGPDWKNHTLLFVIYFVFGTLFLPNSKLSSRVLIAPLF
ncbi:uncharacterized protein K444DRAFT_431870 [Hyaloscypha bicolor E]|uniref:Uncharacterized protein n=1 Tax=Hyaloscypha bicolor E TaxID=1095630 RepID=A0A2J6T5V0_9HELO|nr:uncharacterized protein K444DRAFT_431870 [Hyaloscypha bicolor E]PMD58399.1 hypothetical protein K444DRAFT_431870 [Hyaloscypha bicolor E]